MSNGPQYWLSKCVHFRSQNWFEFIMEVELVLTSFNSSFDTNIFSHFLSILRIIGSYNVSMESNSKAEQCLQSHFQFNMLLYRNYWPPLKANKKKDKLHIVFFFVNLGAKDPLQDLNFFFSDFRKNQSLKMPQHFHLDVEVWKCYNTC